MLFILWIVFAGILFAASGSHWRKAGRVARIGNGMMMIPAVLICVLLAFLVYLVWRIGVMLESIWMRLEKIAGFYVTPDSNRSGSSNSNTGVRED